MYVYINDFICIMGARCSSLVEYMLMIRWVVRSIPPSGPIEQFFLSNQCSTIDVTKAVVSLKDDASK